MPRTVCITGATGYLGRALSAALLERGHGVRALVRPGRAARAAAEVAFTDAGLTATFVRPWYVLGPGHRWPYLLVPCCAVAERLPWTRESARRLGLVTLAQMTRALVGTIEAPPPTGTRRVIDVPAIRAA